jgi:hypothetical protein
MKKFTLIGVLLMFCFVSFAQNSWVKLNSSDPVEPGIQIVESSSDGMIIKLNVNTYALNEVETPRGTSVIVRSPECSNTFTKGNPDLPFITAAINIPDQGGFKAEIISSTFETIENVDIAPSKGSILRIIDPSTVPYEYGKPYSIDAFTPMSQIIMSEPYILRDLRGSNLLLYPFTYNAINNELRVFSEIIVKIKFTQSLSINEIASTKAASDEEFISIYDRTFINYSDSEKYTPVDEGAPGNILIICADEYEDAIADYVTWKQEKGILTELVLMSTVGSTSSNVSTYIQDYYDNTGMTFVLLVGDADDVPTGTEGGNDSDNAYVYVAGSDGYADAFIGRFSANSVADVETQVERTIAYERDMSTSDTWLENAFGSASNEGAGQGHDGGESDEDHINNVTTDLEAYGYTVTNVNQDGGSNAQISTAFNNGIGIANYIGHGDWNQWVNTTYTNTEVNALTNVKKLPFIWSIACVNGDFNGKTCFAEAWLRATSGGSPTGAVAILASTINQAWLEPMTGQDEMVDILMETYSSNIKRTYGGLSFNGMFQMIEENETGQGQETADTWTIFGDPSLMVRTKTPQEISVSHLGTSSVGQTEFIVNCDFDGALVSLTKLDGDETVIIGYDFASDGTANITIVPFDSPGNMKVTVTAYNKVTYQEDVMIIVPDGPYVVHDGYTINDSEANNNGVADFNETIKINQSLLNVGVASAIGVSVIASTTNGNVAITQNAADFSDIVADAVETVNDAFTMDIEDGIADQTSVMIGLAISDNEANEWESSYSILVNAPNMNLDFVEVDDTESGNSNYTVDAGETLNLVVEVLNNGHATSIAGNVVISSTSEYVTIGTSNVDISAQDINTPIEIEFTVIIDESIPTGESLCFDFNLTTGMYTDELNVCLPAGLQIEDWESNTMTVYDWETTGTYPWAISTDQVYEGTYSVKSGNVPSSGGFSTLIINFDVLNVDDLEFYKKVSCEPVWFGTMYDFLSFSIDGAEQDKWAGEVAWSLETYSISAGNRELKWIYTKDDYDDGGSDCAWLDNIKLPAHQASITIINETSFVEENSVEIYPNPASDIAYLNVNLIENTKASVKVINMRGQIVYEYSNEFNLYEGENSIILNTTDYANGLYIIQVVTSDKTYHRNLIISK